MSGGWWRGQGGDSTKWLFLADAGDDDESRKYPRKVRRCTSKKADRRTSSTWKFAHTLRSTGSCFIALFIAANYGLPPSLCVTTTNLGTEHTTTNAHALLLMDSSLMKYLDESARIYCAPARPALSRIVHDKPALISIPETFHRSPLKTTTPDRPLYRFLFPPVPATSIARRVEYSH